MSRGEARTGRAGRAAFALLALLVLAAAACGPKPAPSAGISTGAPPDLRGQQVMVFPVQTVRDDVRSANEELAYALQTRGSATGWLLPEALLEHLARAPGIQMRIEALPVQQFMQAEVNRVGDPLYGHLRRLAALTGADIALIPVEVRRGPGPDGAGSAGGAIEMAAALISARTGHVFWFGIVEGEPGQADDPRVLASAADALAARIIR